MLNPAVVLKNDFKEVSGPLWYSYLEALVTSLVVGLAESYFAAFALKQGLTVLESGLLASLPLFFAAILQLFFQTTTKKLYIHQFVKRSLFLQSLSLVGISVMAFYQVPYAFYVLLFFYSLYWLGHFSIQPAWNRWISFLIKEDLGKNYFSLRTRITQAGIIIGLFVGGSLLHLNIFSFSLNIIFFVLFALCFSLKLFQMSLFSHHPILSETLTLDLKKMKENFRSKFSFLRSYSIYNLSLYISSPFVAGYLLGVRHISYLEFMFVMSAFYAGKVATTYYLNFSEKKFEPYQIFYFGGLLAAPLPVFWPSCTTVSLMMLLHFVSGAAWAFWEVGLSLSFLSKVTNEYKIEMISTYHMLSLLTQVAGTIIGALIFKNYFNENFDYLFVFAGTIRFFCVLGLKSKTI